MLRTHAYAFFLSLLVSTPAMAETPEELALERAIEAIKPVIEKADTNRKPELVFRLAELYAQKARYLKDKAMLAHDSAYVAWIEGGQKGPAPELDDYLRESNAFLRNAHSLGKRVLALDESYGRNDEVLLFLAQSAEALGRGAESAEHYATLLRRFPKSRIVPVAWLRLGEHHFAANRLEPARRAYQRAYETGDGINKRYALHKLAWCDYNSQAWAAGVSKLQRVIASEGSADLRTEALRDLTRFFTHVDDVPAAIAYFAKYGGTDAPKYATRYAAMLFEQGKWPQAVSAQKKILLRYPKHELAEAVRIALLSSLLKVEHYADITNEAKKLAGVASKNESIDGELYAVATELHRLGAKSKRPDQLRAAAATYERYVSRRPNAEARFYFAEVSMMLGAYDDAAKAYDLVADDKKSGRFRVPAALGAVLAYEKTGDMLVAACDRYVRLAPDADDIPEIRYRAAQALDEAGEHHQAAERLLALAKEHPAHEFARTGARRVTERLVAEKKWSEAARYGRLFNERLAKTDRTLARLVEGAAYKSLQAKEQKAQALPEADRRLAVLEVASGFERFVEDFPRSTFADEALLSAALLLSREGRVDRAIEVTSLLVEHYPKSEHAAQAYLLYAELHERIADFASAARMFAQFAADHPKHERAPDALINAGLHFESLGKKTAAQRAFERYVARHADRDDAPRVYLKLCATKRAKRAAKCYGAFAKRWPKAPKTMLIAAKGAQADALEDAGKKRHAAKIHAWLVKAWPRWSAAVKRDAGARRVTAAAAFERAERTYRQLEKQRIRNGRTLAKTTGLLEALVCDPSSAMCKRPGAYVGVLHYGDADNAVAALTRIGDSYTHTAKALSEAPRPTNLTPEQLAIYDSELAKEINELEIRAIDAYRLATRRAQELGVYSEWVVRATAALHRFDDTQWPERQERPVDRIDDLIESPIRTAESSTKAR